MLNNKSIKKLIYLLLHINKHSITITKYIKNINLKKIKNYFLLKLQFFKKLLTTSIILN